MAVTVNEWADLCPDTVVWKPLTGRDAYGKPTYGTAVTYTGRRVYKVQRVASGSPIRGAGGEVVSGSYIIILGTPAVKYEDQVYVQGDSAPYPPIVNIEKHSDESGPFYVKVLFGGI